VSPIVEEALRSPGQPLDPKTPAFFEQRLGHDFSALRVHTDTQSAADQGEERSGLQAKLKVNESEDPYEQEADRIAHQVLAMPARHASSDAPPSIQRFSGPSNRQADATPSSVERVVASPGKPLEPALRQDMEQRFGHDFSRVRIHSGVAAAQSAQDVNAHAYTMGPHIVFGSGRLAPGTQEGRRLLAHELTHVVQQGATASTPGIPAQERTGQQKAAGLAPEAAKGKSPEKSASGAWILQRQPRPEPDTEPRFLPGRKCPVGQVEFGGSCVPLILPGRKCPRGQVEFGGVCVPLHLPVPPSGTSPTGTSPTGTSPFGASDNGKSLRVRRIEDLRGCAYTVTYSNPRKVDCDTAFRRGTGRAPTAPLCGVSFVYDITSVSAIGSKCPRLEGLTVSEKVKGDHGCTPPNFNFAPGSCPIGAGGNVTNCTDTFTVCGDARDLRGSGCKEIVDQEIEVGGQLAEVHEITFDLKKSDKDCTGEVRRITGD
jgi:hypothetical protein